ncbi:MAG: alpha-L-rhamnosidase N-terminal domain-containing protein [Planctomycetes bacterium]|nr:alpha-L-rhamnosidase N-terminal domain-containing protein [Planctomycetota bacterium]
MPTFSQDANYVWFDESGCGRNRFAAFRYVFNLRERSAGGSLSIFADTAYKLYVNGMYVNTGPARFDPANPLYDTHDLAGYLRKGKNVIAVLVNHYGEMTYFSRLARGGMIAWGTVRDGKRKIAIRTPDCWKVRREEGFDSTAPKLSFPINPIEVYDQARGLGRWMDVDYDDSKWSPTVVLAGPLPWGKLQPRTIPFLENREILPERVVSVQAIRDEEALWSFRIPFIDERHPDRPKYSNFLFAYTELYAPRDMDVKLGLFWGEYWLNGVELTDKRQSEHAVCRIDYAAHLKQGWNTFFFKCGAYGDTWDFYMAVPREAGIEVSADRSPSSDVLFRVSRPLLVEEYEKFVKPVGLPFTGRETFGGLPDAWREWKRGRTADNPAKETDLLLVDDVKPTESPYKISDLVFPKSQFPHGIAVTFDLGQDYNVRPSISLSGVKGATVDMAYSELLRNGRAELYYIHHRTHAADRFHACQDGVEWTVFHPRGFRYLTCVIRNAPGDVTLRAVKGISAMYPVRDICYFRCSDPLLDKIWDLCRRSQKVVMEDLYNADLYRERSMYGRDTMIQYMCNLACFGDQALMRRSLDIFIQTMSKDGHILACCPLDWDYFLYDFALNDVVGFWEYYKHSGDGEFAKSAWRAAAKAVEAMEIFEQPSGLLSADRKDMRTEDRNRVTNYGINHSDNGARADHHDKDGLSCNFNATWVGAMRAAANLCRAAGEKKKAGQLDARANRIAAKIRELLWDPRRQLFADNLRKKHYSVQGNALCVLHGVAVAKQLPSIRRFLAAELEDNFYGKVDPADGNRMSPAYGYYVLEGLYKAGLPGTAEKVIRKCWGWMLGDGATTVYEFFTARINQLVGHDRNSRCVSWSASPAWFLSRDVLGVRFPQPGNPDVITVVPCTESVTWAEGAYPHPRGRIEVRWERKNGRFRAEILVPPAVRVLNARKCGNGRFVSEFDVGEGDYLWRLA